VASFRSLFTAPQPTTHSSWPGAPMPASRTSIVRQAGRGAGTPLLLAAEQQALEICPWPAIFLCVTHPAWLPLWPPSLAGCPRWGCPEVPAPNLLPQIRPLKHRLCWHSAAEPWPRLVPSLGATRSAAGDAVRQHSVHVEAGPCSSTATHRNACGRWQVHAHLLNSAKLRAVA
jgi:hypothetical protein